MRIIRRAGLLLLGCGLMVGCANVKVKKVDVQKRIEGRDQHVRGFRYYLNRPYIIVTKPVSVATQLAPVALGTVPPGRPANAPGSRLVFVSLVPNASGQFPVYNTLGEVEPGLTPENVDPVTVDASGQTKGANGSGTATPSGVTDEEKTILARAVADRVFVEVEKTLLTVPASTFEPLADNLVNATIHQTQPTGGENLKAYGTRVIPDLLTVSLNSLDTLVKFPNAATQAQFHQTITDLGKPLANGLFNPTSPTTPNGPILLARSVGLVVGVSLSRSLFPSEQVQNLVLNGLIAAAEKGYLEKKPAPTTLKAVVNAAFDEMIKRAQDTTTTQILGRDQNVRAAIEKELTERSGQPQRDALAKRLLGKLVDTSISPVSAPPLPQPQPATATRGAFAAAPADSGKGASGGDTKTTAPAPTGDPDAFQVAFLPDFEEQYAIRNKNVLARTKYQYQFRNGTELAAFSGNYNATDVPVKLVETVGTLIQAAGAIARQRISPAAPIAGAALRFAPAGEKVTPFYIKIEWVIEPGIYRVQKSWERVAAMPTDGLDVSQVHGMFTEIGLEIREVRSVVTKQQYADELKRLNDRADKGLGRTPAAPTNPPST